MIEFLLLFLAFYIWHSLGVTIGYHRLLSHRSFSCPKWLEYFWVLPGYLAFEGSPIWWATIHRAHHRYVDTQLDPHSPRYGMQYAHWGWLLEPGYKSHVNPATQSKDLIDDPIYKFLEQGGDHHRSHRLVFVASIGFRLAIWAFFGWVPALASLLAGVAVLQIPLMLNVVCHIPKLGYKTFATTDDSVNVWWVALLANGEGWHNNHHAYPGSAKTGMLPWEVDLSWLIIKTMHLLKLVSRVNVAVPKPVQPTVEPALAAKAEVLAEAAVDNALPSAERKAPILTVSSAIPLNQRKKARAQKKVAIAKRR